MYVVAFFMVIIIITLKLACFSIYNLQLAGNKFQVTSCTMPPKADFAMQYMLIITFSICR